MIYLIFKFKGIFKGAKNEINKTLLTFLVESDLTINYLNEGDQKLNFPVISYGQVFLNISIKYI